jgi:ribonucleotide monophosphatase NagD (HAD superfamily)
MLRFLDPSRLARNPDLYFEIASSKARRKAPPMPGGTKFRLIYNVWRNILHVSCEVGWRKPDKRIYLAVLSQAGLEMNRSVEVLFVGDNRECDIVGPRLVGMQSLGYGLEAHP